MRGKPLAKHPIFRTEIMAPMRDAVRFIDGKQGNAVREATQQIANRQPFRTDVKQIKTIGVELSADPQLFFCADVGVQSTGTQSGLARGRLLIIHQGDQRTDDQHQTGPARCGNLITQTLATTGRQDHQRILFSKRCPNSIRLERTEIIIAPKPPQRVTRLHAFAYRHHTFTQFRK